jgi:hypothetical protein
VEAISAAELTRVADCRVASCDGEAVSLLGQFAFLCRYHQAEARRLVEQKPRDQLVRAARAWADAVEALGAHPSD